MPIAHASIGPSSALAQLEAGRLTVRTHSKGVFPLRAVIARTLGLPVADVKRSGCWNLNSRGKWIIRATQHDAASEEKTMARRPRRNHSLAFRPKFALAAIKGEKTMIGLAQDFDVHPNQIEQWRSQLLEGATGVFGEAPKTETEPSIDVKTPHAKIGEANSGPLSFELVF